MKVSKLQEVYILSNKEIYKKTLKFSVKKLLVDFLSIVLLAALCSVGFIVLEQTVGKGLIGLAIGLIIGIIALIFISRFVSYSLKAGQIAMMTKGIVENELPDDVYKEGKAIVKSRFKTVAAFFAITGVIKGIFNQLGKLITSVGEKVGGNAGETIGAVISGVVQVIISYLCDCCLGWVFFREGQNAAKATCEGAVIFFKHGNTLAKNAGRIFGMGVVSLLVIGGAFFGIFYGISFLVPDIFKTLASEVAEASVRFSIDAPAFLTDANVIALIISGILGVIVWSILHSTFIRPFVLTGVLRNYIESGKDNIPSEDSFAFLDSKSSKFAKLRKEAGV